MSERVQDNDHAPSCFFRSVLRPPEKKIMLQITEKCNMCCNHCFVSSTGHGKDMKYEDIEKIILPFLLESKTKKITLTGGEPLTHNYFCEIVELLYNNGMDIAICTNGSLADVELLDKMHSFTNIHFNISLDGYSTKSYDRFRGNSSKRHFDNVVSNIRNIAKKGLLNGILVTPNAYTHISEYEEICKFGIDIGAKYILMNPLSEFGRGNISRDKALSVEEMIELRSFISHYSNEIEILFIRFPNDNLPLGKCIAGRIPYIFTNGDIALCPYMAFASKNEESRYGQEEFILGNVFNSDKCLDDMINSFELPTVENKVCDSCSKNRACGRGCHASKIAKGMLISDIDPDLCPSARRR